jgi:hypothetical protein
MLINNYCPGRNVKQVLLGEDISGRQKVNKEGKGG